MSVQCLVRQYKRKTFDQTLNSPSSAAALLNISKHRAGYYKQRHLWVEGIKNFTKAFDLQREPYKKLALFKRRRIGKCSPPVLGL